MSFKCTIPGVSLKVFGRAIQSLSKIGDELYFEPREDGLFLRSVNSCRSAYACFQFSPSFFNHFVDVSNLEETEDEETFRCKIGMKSVMTVFRNLAAIDKTVEKCRISLNTVEDRLVFQMYCRHGIIKTHKLAFIECETLQAVASKEMCPNKITSLPKLLCDAVLNFQANQEEITLIVRPDFLALQNYVDDDQDATKVMRTELTLSPSEFDHYQVGVDADITFCLKELRAILAFADITNLPVTLHFESAGRPITFSITGDLSYEGTFVLATLAEIDASTATQLNSQGQSSKSNKSSRKQQQSSRHNGHLPTIREKSHHSNARREGEELRRKNENENLCNSSYRKLDEEEDEQGMSSTFAVEDASITNPSSFMQHGRDGRKSMHVHTNSQEVNRANHDKRVKMNKNNNDDLSLSAPAGQEDHYHNLKSKEGSKTASSFNTSMYSKTKDSYSRARRSDEGGVNLSFTDQRGQGQQTDMDEPEAEDVGSPVIPVQNVDFSVMDDVEEEDGEDEVPATPPSKKFRSVFFGTQSSTQPSQSQSKAEILAPNSDDDD